MGWGNPYMGWGNPYHMNPWNTGGGWTGGGDLNSGSRPPVAPPRGGGIGGGTPRQSSLFNPNPGRNTSGGSASNRINNGVGRSTATPTRETTTNPSRGTTATPARGTTTTPGRQTGDRNSRIIEESRPTRTPSRNTWDGGSSPTAPSNRTPARVTPTPRPSGGGSATPSRGSSYNRGGSSATPSRSGDSGGGSASPSRSGGSRPSGGTSSGRPR